jgi:hypothetical protein
LKSILVFSHKHNSLNKEKLLEHPEQTKTVPSRFTVDDFIKDPVLKQFYMYDMNNLLVNYEPGRPENKPIIWKLNPTNNIHSLKKFIKDVPNTGGGDSPEAYELVLKLIKLIIINKNECIYFTILLDLKITEI